MSRTIKTKPGLKAGISERNSEMKKIFALAFMLAFAFSVFSQNYNVTLESTVEFNFNGSGQSDQFFGMIVDEEDNVFLNGENTGVPLSSGLMKFDAQGSVLWSFTDSFSGAVSGRGQIFYLSGKNKVGYFSSGSTKNIVFRNKETGLFIQSVPKTESYSFAPTNTGDSIIAISQTSDAVLVLDEFGNSSRQFSVQENLNGFTEIRVWGNEVWVFGTYATNNAFVGKYNLLTGQQMWRVNIFGMIQVRGDVDSLGNSYIGCSKRDSTNTHYLMKVMKINSVGTILWDKEWKANPQWGASGNINILTSSVSVNARIGVVVVGAQIQRDATNNGATLAYFSVRNAASGDSLHSLRFANNASLSLNGVRNIAFRSDNKMIVCGFQLGTPYTNTGWMKRYLIDSMVGIEPNTETAEKYSLSQNYPNPFNPKTKIEFSIPEKGNVKITVFDVLGKEVQILINEVKTKGNYSITFDGKNISSGIYFYRIETPEFTETKKMMLVK